MKSRPKPQPHDYLTPEDVAQRLGVHANTVRLWCVAGRIGTRVGGRYRILEAELSKVAAGWANVPGAR
jgi:excisionase family DNA binding protein